MNEWFDSRFSKTKNQNKIILIINYLQLPLEAGWSNVCQTNDWSALKDWRVMRPTGSFLPGRRGSSKCRGRQWSSGASLTRLFFARELLCSAAAVEVNNKFSILFGKTGLALLPTADQIGNYKKKIKWVGPRLTLLNCCPVGGTLKPHSCPWSQLKGVSRVRTLFNWQMGFKSLFIIEINSKYSNSNGRQCFF